MDKPTGGFYSRANYLLILISVAMLITGFILMTGNANTGSETFNSEIYSFRRITLSPLILLLGYALLFYAIMYRKRMMKKDE